MTTILFSLFAFFLPYLSQDFEKLAPFTAVRFENEIPHVQVEGKWWILESIDDIPAEKLVSFCRKQYGKKWDKRFGEDLVQVMSEFGKPPGNTVKLELRAEKGDTKHSIPRAAMSKENRKKVHAANQEKLENKITINLSPGPLSRTQALADFQELVATLESKFSYYSKSGNQVKEWIKEYEGILSKSPETIDLSSFTVLMMKFIARFGDGHTNIQNENFLLKTGYLPCLLSDTGTRIVAFQQNRSGFVDENHPYLVAIDGVPMDRWIHAAGALVAQGSPQFIRHHSLKTLRYLNVIRSELGLPEKNEVTLELESENPGDRKTVNLKVSTKYPTYGVWPSSKTRRIGKIGYIRMETMSSATNPNLLTEVYHALDEFKDCTGLVIDVRGNGGGEREITQLVVSRLLPAGENSRVVNIAAKRLEPGESAELNEELLSNRRLFTRNSKRFDDKDRAVIDATFKGFKPEWTFPSVDFSAWHFFLIRRDEQYALGEKKVIVLMNGDCFSATDIFLGAVQGLPGITLLGTESGGGSGRPNAFILSHSNLEMRCSTMASFRRDGSLYDGRGVTPDIKIFPIATDFIGKTDSQLEAALARLVATVPAK